MPTGLDLEHSIDCVSSTEQQLTDIRNQLHILESDVILEILGRLEALEKIIKNGYLLDD